MATEGDLAAMLIAEALKSARGRKYALGKRSLERESVSSLMEEYRKLKRDEARTRAGGIVVQCMTPGDE